MSVAIELDALEFAAGFGSDPARSDPADFDPADSDPAEFDPSRFPTVPLPPARLREATRPVPAGPFSAPLISAPARRRPIRTEPVVGLVTVLHPPAPQSAPLRLTRRGVVVLALAVAALGLALVWVAALSAPSPSAAPARGPAVVTVHSGDTLWSIASSVAPNSDPAAEVAVLQKLNHVTADTLVAGQRLRVR